MAAPADVQGAVAEKTLAALKEAERRLDAEIEKLDALAKEDVDSLRQKRITELKAQQAKEQLWRAQGHGKYTEIADQKEWFQVVKDNERVICHFYRPSTWRCQLVDKHLALLAAKHLEAKFIKLDAEKSPFLAERLQIVVLPTIVCTKDNFTLDTVEGFTELGNTDEFTTETLEKRLALKGAILYDGGEPAKTISKFSMNTVRDNKQGRAVYQSKSAKQGGGGDEDSDDSWDDSDSDNE